MKSLRGVRRGAAIGVWLAVAAGCLASPRASAASSEAEPQSRGPPDRPRIGLVLSGGGARGAAHIGVLKALEELRVPVDAVAGTSMGAVVGGLYASGLSAREIESVMTSLDWEDAFRDRPPRADLTFRRKQEDQNFLVRFPLGLRGGRFLLPKGLIQGQKLNQALRGLTLPVADVTDFNKLPAAFRAVAADLETGDPVILSGGDLTTAMRASMSAPGVFAPVELDGRLLVDGGIAENLPIDVARTMNVDVLIVVDVGFPLLPRERLASVPVISNQMLAILVRRDSRRQRATLSDRDVVIDPPLGDASSYDFSGLERAIGKGEKAALAERERLQALAIPADAYERFAKQREIARSTPPRIEFVRVEPGRYDRALNSLFGEFVGADLPPDDIARRISRYYGRGNLESLDYRLVREDEKYGLILSARRNSWGPNYVRFGLNLQDDFQGNANYNAAARVVLSEITDPGGEWVWDGQIGESPRAATEIYLPLSQTSQYFFMPYARFEARNVPVLDDQVRIAEYRVRSFRYGLDFGREFGNWGEIRAGVLREDGRARVRIGDPSLPQSDFNASGFFTRFAYDGIDDVNFPRRGMLASLEWNGERKGFGSESSTDRVELNWLGAISFGPDLRNTAALWTSAGSTLDESDPAEVRALFPLGGFFNLSGLKADSITGAHYGIARLLMYRQIGRAGPGFLDVPTYLGFSLEAGNVWDRRSDASFGSARKDASVFLGLDTLLGPVYLGTGFDDGGTEAFYLFLGRTF